MTQPPSPSAAALAEELVATEFSQWAWKIAGFAAQAVAAEQDIQTAKLPFDVRIG